MPSHIVTVLEVRVPEVMAEITRLTKKAAKHGFTGFSVEPQGMRFEERKFRRDPRYASGTFTTMVALVDVEVKWDTFSMGDYEFVARVELGSEREGNLIWKVPGIEMDMTQFHFQTGHCDHCKQNRRRKDTYVVRHRETGEVLQVGSTCLKDFMGCNPADILARFEFFKQLGGVGGGDCESIPVGWCFTTEFLAYTVAAVRCFGWVSRTAVRAYEEKYGDSDKQATVDVVMDLMFGCGGNSLHAKALLNTGEDGDYDVARRMTEWALFDWAEEGDYAHNLKTVLRRGVVGGRKEAAILASLVNAYYKAHEEKTGPVSKHVGKPGERVSGIKVRCTLRRSLGVGQYGERFLVKFVDTAGNILSWFTTTPKFVVDDTAEVSVTVKEHKAFKGINETVVTNVRS